MSWYEAFGHRTYVQSFKDLLQTPKHGVPKDLCEGDRKGYLTRKDTEDLAGLGVDGRKKRAALGDYLTRKDTVDLSYSGRTQLVTRWVWRECDRTETLPGSFKRVIGHMFDRAVA
jgi:hypothetical protein